MLAPSGGGLILYQAYGNLYAMTGRKAHLLEDKQIPNVGVFDELFYVNSTTMGKGKEKRNVPAIHYLNSEMLRIREKEDLESGGFMLKTRIDPGKKKENLVRDIGTIGRMRYVDETQAGASIKVERVDCNSTKADNHKDANTSGMRKLEIMPCESNNEEFASVLTSEFDKILSMFVKIDGVMEKRLKICHGDPFIKNFMLTISDKLKETSQSYLKRADEVESSFEKEMQKRRRLSFEAPSFSLGFTQSMTPIKNDPSEDDNVDNVVWDTSGSVSVAYKGFNNVIWDKTA
ncbi:hypothetical protein Tco_1297766 [Tanacetum coccineum]